MQSKGLDGIKQRWWLFLGIFLSIALGMVGMYLPPEIYRPDFDIIEFNLIIGGDALALMGFIIQALAIIGALVDRTALDSIRGHSSFRDLWMTFVFSAICLGIQAMLGRFLTIFILPDYVPLIAGILAIFNCYLIGACIILLARLISLVNEGRKLDAVTDEHLDDGKLVVPK
jgi:hypothetical protein